MTHTSAMERSYLSAVNIAAWRPLLKDPRQPPPSSMPSQLLILLGEAKSYCFTVTCAHESMFMVILSSFTLISFVWTCSE